MRPAEWYRLRAEKLVSLHSGYDSSKVNLILKADMSEDFRKGMDPFPNKRAELEGQVNYHKLSASSVESHMR